MPIRSYIAVKPGKCPLCRDPFEHSESGSQTLTECPRCGAPVVRQESVSVHVPKLLKPTSYTDAKKAGFTVLKKISKGEYEKQ